MVYGAVVAFLIFEMIFFFSLRFYRDLMAIVSLSLILDGQGLLGSCVSFH